MRFIVEFKLKLLSKLFVYSFVSLFILVSSHGQAQAQSVGFQVALIEQLKNDDDAIAFYQANKFKPIWTGNGFGINARRTAFFKALDQSLIHALPRDSYRAAELKAALRAARTDKARGAIEGAMTRTFLDYATDMQTGVLVPSRVDKDIVRKVPYRARQSYLTALVKSSPSGFFKALIPSSDEYKRLLKVKEDLLQAYARGGWGPKISTSKLSPGSQGKSVVALRNRLIAQGYLGRTNTQTYDANIQKAVQLFQLDHGLSADGVAGPATLGEMNKTVEQRLASVIVAMERERWINKPKGQRHIWVNLADFSAKIVDRGRVTFRTRAVIGSDKDKQRSPEFSDVMEHMVINPTWNVPRSIVVDEYLPMLKKNPNAVGFLDILNNKGQIVGRGNIDFSQYTEKTFPFAMRQPPSTKNALGLVKFMFPNKYNIYLHDTPAKSLFNRETRAFSHGCIRLHQPFEFAYELLSKQTSNPKGVFHSALDSKKETYINLKQQVPVHLIYRTAITKVDGGVEFRRDIYGRDARIFSALQKAGVVIGGVQG